MKQKGLESVLDYISGALRMIGVAAFMTSALAIVFSRPEATDYPATVSILLFVGLAFIGLGAVVSYYSAKDEE